MGKFDSYGGNFTPNNYLSVNAGGSHEENPNGGVQVGVDENGTPNVLEEGEPVYNDYVFSDNIRAEEESLIQNNIPKKYAGKLYSEIADAYLAEFEDMELDPITRKGLDAMLSRLANAQEQQKQAEQELELEEYINSLSPEELQELEQQLAASEQLAIQEQAAQQQLPPEEQIQVEQPQIPIEQQQVPMMACGGRIRRYDNGGDLPDAPTLVFDKETGSAYPINQVQPFTYEPTYDGGTLDPAVVTAYPGKTQAWVEAETSPFKRGVTDAIDAFPTQAGDFVRSAPGWTRLVPGAGNIISGLDAVDDLRDKDYLSTALDAAVILPGLRGTALKGMSHSVKRSAKRNMQSIGKKVEEGAKKLDDAKVARSKALSEQISSDNRLNKLYDKLDNATTPSKVEKITSSINKEKEKFRELTKEVRKTGADVVKQEVAQAGRKIKEGAANLYGKVVGAVPKAEKAAERVEEVAENAAKGNSVIKNLIKSAAVLGTPAALISIAANRRANRMLPQPDYGVLDAITRESFENQKKYIDSGLTSFDDAMPIDSTNVRKCGGSINRYDWGGAVPAAKIIAGKKQMPVFNLPNASYNSGLAGMEKYGYGNMLPASVVTDSYPEYRNYTIQPAVVEDTYSGPKINMPGASYGMDIVRRETGPYNTVSYLYNSDSLPSVQFTGRLPYSTGAQLADVGNRNSSIADKAAENTDGGKYNGYSTLGMYAPAALGASMGLWNAFQPIDKYGLPRYHAFEPYGEYTYQNQYYRPEDANRILNEYISQGNGLIRQIGNSGAGPGNISAILAADKHIGQNTGNAWWQGIQNNLQAKNAAIQANNQYASTKSQFDLMRDRYAQAERARAEQLNNQQDLLGQQLNYNAEGDYYAALQNQLQATANALANIALNNYRYNEINTDTSNEGYMKASDGSAFYGKCGGSIKRKK